MKHPSGRALRRHHRDRVIAKRLARRKIWWPDWLENTTPQHLAKFTGSLASTGTHCSCWMCGNPRRHEGEITIAEKKALLSLKDGLVAFSGHAD